MMTAPIHTSANYPLIGAVLAERHRRDAADPLWRFRLIRRRERAA